MVMSARAVVAERLSKTPILEGGIVPEVEVIDMSKSKKVPTKLVLAQHMEQLTNAERADNPDMFPSPALKIGTIAISQEVQFRRTFRYSGRFFGFADLREWNRDKTSGLLCELVDEEPVILPVTDPNVITNLHTMAGTAKTQFIRNRDNTTPQEYIEISDHVLLVDRPAAFLVAAMQRAIQSVQTA